METTATTRDALIRDTLRAYQLAQAERYAARTEADERFWTECLQAHRERLRLLSVGK